MIETYFETKLGKLYNADCAQVLPQIISNSVDLVVTDIPYGFDCRGRGANKDNLWNDTLRPGVDYAKWFDEIIIQLHRVLKNSGAIYVYCGWRIYPLVYPIIAGKFSIKNCIVWRKQHFGVGFLFRFQHEFCIFATKGTHKLRVLKKNISDVWDIERENNQRKHPAQKPLEAMLRPIKYSTDGGGASIRPIFWGWNFLFGC